MRLLHLKKIIRILLLLAGAVLLITELYATTKNYYLQSAGVICVMLALFLLNITIPYKEKQNKILDKEQDEC